MLAGGEMMTLMETAYTGEREHVGTGGKGDSVFPKNSLTETSVVLFM